MEIGLFGLPLTGKTTIFSLLTNTKIEDGFKREAIKRTAQIKDKRLETLSKMYNPERTIYATLEFIDIPSYDHTGDSKEKTRILQMIQNVDALLLVIRAFNNDSVPWPQGAEDAIKQLKILETELMIRDLQVIENRLERLENQKKKTKISSLEEKEEEILKKIRENLENEIFVSKIELNEEDKKLIGSMALFTLKPIIVCVNVDDEQFGNKRYPFKEKVLEECQNQNFAYIEIDGKIEVEINEFEDPQEKKMFMEELSIDEPGIERLAKIVYNHVGLISFFTVGKDEVRAWTIKKGTTMKEAAGKIHSDFEKNFIRAEVMKYEDLINYGSEEKVKEHGLWKLAGKDEIVEDGEILNIRANA
ncbi:DUF933 domain-containing protein [Petrotoga sp. 9PWA.NaAc.5.4]|uniref:DUF933 domain-containing protein n=1 Tax=Petrotoga sp. 9PWA.NaAc.5.4 TaxID=1434328 RepID=UPI000CABD637|nr:DUF933 domain-containing protein [Petrotoga sp. 9PWA.NaAc.5.4]PNR96640.1 GTP-binding protein [Petrotoga sp. 9PWA.NaAc.5.4]